MNTETKADKAKRNVVGATHQQIIAQADITLGGLDPAKYGSEGRRLVVEIELRREWWEAYPPHDPTWRTVDGQEVRERYELSICAHVPDPTSRRRDWEQGGQCVYLIEQLVGFPNPGDPRAVRILELWRRWHLNGMRAGCVHQLAAGKPPDGKVTRYHWRLNEETRRHQAALQRDVERRVRELGRVELTPAEQAVYRLKYAAESWTPEAPSPDYEPKRPLYAGDSAHEEVKSLMWLRADEHPEGQLSRPCPECGYKYGSEWLTEVLPLDVVAEVVELCGRARP